MIHRRIDFAEKISLQDKLPGRWSQFRLKVSAECASVGEWFVLVEEDTRKKVASFWLGDCWIKNSLHGENVQRLSLRRHKKTVVKAGERESEREQFLRQLFTVHCWRCIAAATAAGSAAVVGEQAVSVCLQKGNWLWRPKDDEWRRRHQKVINQTDWQTDRPANPFGVHWQPLCECEGWLVAVVYIYIWLTFTVVL